MLLLVLLPFAGLHLVQLLANSLAPVLLSAHFQTFIQNSKTAFRFDDLTTEIVIITVHGRDFFIKLLHGSDTVALQKGKRRGAQYTAYFFRSVHAQGQSGTEGPKGKGG